MIPIMPKAKAEALCCGQGLESELVLVLALRSLWWSFRRSLCDSCEGEKRHKLLLYGPAWCNGTELN